MGVAFQNRSAARSGVARGHVVEGSRFVLSKPLGADERREEVNDDGGSDRDGDVGHWGDSQMCSQAVVNARQRPRLASPSANIAGSQTNRFIIAS
jgi:hypothetical protein